MAAIRARAPDHLLARARPPASPVRASQRGRPAALHVAQGAVDADRRPEGDERVEHAYARLGDQHGVRGGQQQGGQRPAGRETQAARQRVDEGDQRRAGERARHAPAPGVVAQGGDAGGDRHHAQGRVGERAVVARLPGRRRERSDAAVQQGVRVVHVVVLVEDDRGEDVEIDQSHDGREGDDDQHERDDRAARPGAAG